MWTGDPIMNGSGEGKSATGAILEIPTILLSC